MFNLIKIYLQSFFELKNKEKEFKNKKIKEELLFSELWFMNI